MTESQAEGRAKSSEQAGRVVLSVIVPARDEAEGVGDCLRSLASQADAGFRLGEDWELLLVDDGSTDGTRAIAEAVEGVVVMAAPALEHGWTGKANAVAAAAKVARGEWLLFTDADTVHEAGDLRRALHEAERANAVLLSYSPRQIVRGIGQRAVMPLIFAELAAAYPPKLVSDLDSRVVAANGQFLMVERETYLASGGHAAVRGAILEDVELAARIKRGLRNAKAGRGGKTIRFRYAPDALSTRMYRSFPQMVEGWTKNLALLFPNVLVMLLARSLDFALLAGLPFLAAALRPPVSYAVMLWWLWRLTRHFTRVAKSNFPVTDWMLSLVGIPLFLWLLGASWFHHTVTKQVAWKGRKYAA